MHHPIYRTAHPTAFVSCRALASHHQMLTNLYLNVDTTLIGNQAVFYKLKLYINYQNNDDAIHHLMGSALVLVLQLKRTVPRWMRLPEDSLHSSSPTLHDCGYMILIMSFIKIIHV